MTHSVRRLHRHNGSTDASARHFTPPALSVRTRRARLIVAGLAFSGPDFLFFAFSDSGFTGLALMAALIAFRLSGALLPEPGS